MAKDLRSRLNRIRSTSCASVSKETIAAKVPGNDLSWPDWTEAGLMTLKRTLYLDLPDDTPVAFPAALAILIPDFAGMGRLPLPEELLFFDLETTGLSMGAGTIAFLAAFGRFMAGANQAGTSRLEITQYLLLDYPGESNFIERVTEKFSVPNAKEQIPVIVSYNGKTFDSQILKNRCLMNGIREPGYFHADLLHPARKLWRTVLPSCSQAVIEVSVLGLDRTGDLSGALAPDIWFAFLRSGENSELLAICEHNVKDIFGLASLFLAFVKIAEDPLAGREKYGFDLEALAVSWERAVRKRPFLFDEDTQQTGQLLLETAAQCGYKRAVYKLALDCLKNERRGEGRALLRKITEEESADSSYPNLRAAALKALAVDAEWSLGDYHLAMDYTAGALRISGISPSFRKELEKRRARLEEKIPKSALRP